MIAEISGSCSEIRDIRRHEQVTLIKKIGARLREARELSCLPQQDAAVKLGYAGSPTLAKIEAGQTTSVPLDVLVRASLLYEVSTDYLFGLTDDWETSNRAEQERLTSGWLFGLWEAQRKRDTQRDAAVLKKLHDRIEATRNIVDDMLRHAASLEDAMTTFISMNPQFEHMKGGATLAAVTDRISAAARSGRAALDRLRNECVRAAVNDR